MSIVKPTASAALATRPPAQKRSIDRVNCILEATRVLIAERGSAGLKVQDIADQAGITAGSMYQYFPNKAAIIQALGQRYLDETADMIALRFEPPPKDWHDMESRIHAAFDDYYALHLNDPVIQDIFMGAHADKSLRAIDDADTERNAETVFAACHHLFSEQSHLKAKQALLLLAGLTNTAIRLALKQNKEDATTTVLLFKKITTSTLRAFR